MFIVGFRIYGGFIGREKQIYKLVIVFQIKCFQDGGGIGQIFCSLENLVFVCMNYVFLILLFYRCLVVYIIDYVVF